MQDPDLVETSSSVEASNCSFLQRLSAEICTVSFPGASEESGRDRSSQNRQLGGLEAVQENFPSEGGDGGDFEASWDSPPDAFAAESSNAWGDFESFSEVKVDSQGHTPELLENLNGEQASTNDIDINDYHFTTSCERIFSGTAGHRRRDACLNVPVKATLSSEDVIKLSFPEVPVPQFSENISGLNEMLGTKTEDADIPERTKMQPCTGSGNLWKILTRTRNSSGLRCPWNESHCQENLLAVLGIDVHQKVLPQGQEDVLENSSLEEAGDSNVDKVSTSHCEAPIQTKLSASPDPRQSHLFTYNLFLKKTPSTGHMQYITVPQKKRIFTAQSLKLKMFSSNVC